jgi:hypothetical protein
MKLTLGIIAAIIFLTIGMLLFWARVMKYGADILEYDHPSRDIKHAIEKGVFIDTLEILTRDTIRDSVWRINIVPTTSWVERATFWRSDKQHLDSIGFSTDTVVLLINFKAFANGKPMQKKGFGNLTTEFTNDIGLKEFVYLDDDRTQLKFVFNKKIPDTIKLSTADGQQITIMGSLSHR